MSMIPKTIHYFRFGKGKKTHLINKCIQSRHKYLPTYQIIERNEDNFNINENEFVEKAYREKKWAFVSDYARLKVLYTHGGIYLDTDMEVLKSFDDLLGNNVFIGYESHIHVNASIVGAKIKNTYIQSCLQHYQTMNQYVTIPIIMTEELNKIGLQEYGTQIIQGIKIYQKEYFYPIAFGETIDYSKITSQSYTLHHWNTTRFPWYGKLAKKLKLLKVINWGGKIKNNILHIFKNIEGNLQ